MEHINFKEEVGRGKGIVILEELSDFIVPLNKEEREQLEQNILLEGCRDPLTLWENENSLVLVDGHNRFDICKRNNIEFKVHTKEFEDLEEVKEWMINNQLGRRNLTQDQVSYYRGLKYEGLKKKKGGYAYVESKGQNDLSTSEKLAGEFKVSESTIKRDAKFATGLELIGKSNPNLKNKILSGEVKVKKSDIQTLSQLVDKENLKIVNEADIYNKAKQIRNETISQIEKELKEVNEKRVEEAQEVLKQSDPLFLEKDERIQRIKANIISAINIAINKRDHDAIIKIKKLIDRLENELF
jgi:hypothetical protein